MKMTKKLANALLDALACVAIEANGGYSIDENGNPILTDEQKEIAETYARNTFESILLSWEDEMGKTWKIVKAGNKNDSARN